MISENIKTEFLQSQTEFIAGVFGGAFGTLVGHPLDTIKVRLQSRPGIYKGIFHCFKSIKKHEGIKGYFKGVSSPMATLAFIQGSVYFTEKVLENQLNLPTWVSGAGSGVVHSVLISPVDLTKIQMQVQGVKGIQNIKSYSSTLNVISRTYKNSGVRGIFRGYNLTVIRDVPAFAAYFLVYDYFSQTLFPTSNLFSLEGISHTVLSGGVAGCASWGITYPLDVVKSCMQADKLTSVNGRKYESAVDCCMKLYKSDNSLRPFFRGLKVAMLRAFVINGAIFYGIEASKEIMKRQ